MIYYIMASGHKDDVTKLYQQMPYALNEALTFVPGAFKYTKSANGLWAAAVSATTSQELEERMAASQCGICCVNGPMMLDEDGGVAGQILKKLCSSSPQYVFDNAMGNWNCASITLHNQLCAFCDFTSMYPLYYAVIDDVLCVSNRAIALWKLSGKNALDYMALSWIVGHSTFFGDRTIFKDVYCLPADHYLKSIIGSGKYELHRMGSCWPQANGERLKSLEKAEWDTIVDLLIRNFRACHSKFGDENYKCSLTGGKDSRLILSLACAALPREKIQTFTNGRQGSPEILYAQNVAAAVNVHHESHISKVVNTSEDYEKRWKLLRTHLHRTEGMVCPWDMQGETAFKGLRYFTTGFGGEMYRGPGGYCPRLKDLSFLSDMDHGLWKFVNYATTMNAMDILNDDAVLYQRGWFATVIKNNLVINPLDILPEKIYIQQRLHHWNGPSAQGVTARVHLNPMILLQVAKLYYQLDAQARSLELLHFNVISRCAPDLVTIPFFNKSWHHDLLKYEKICMREDTLKNKVFNDYRAVHSWQEDFIKNQKNEIIAFFLKAKRITDVENIFSVDKIVAYMRKREEFSVPAMLIILSAISCCHLLLGKIEKAQDKPGEN